MQNLLGSLLIRDDSEVISWLRQILENKGS